MLNGLVDIVKRSLLGRKPLDEVNEDGCAPDNY